VSYPPGPDQPPYPAPPVPPGQPPQGYPGYPGYPAQGQPGYQGYPGQPGPYHQPPYAPPNTTLAVVAHLGPFIGGFVVPLIIFIVSKDDQFARRHAAEALNAQITYTVVAVSSMLVVFLPLMVFGAGVGGEAAAIGFLFAMFGVMALIFGYALVLAVSAVIAMVRAGKREEFRYPLTVRLVKP
jgi:uncharacterized protein